MSSTFLKFIILGALLCLAITALIAWPKKRAYFVIATPILVGFQPFLDYGYSQAMGILFVPLLWGLNLRFRQSSEPFSRATIAWYVWIIVIIYGAVFGLFSDAYKLDLQNADISPLRQLVEVTSSLVASLWLLTIVNALSRSKESEEQFLFGAMAPLFLAAFVVLLINVGLSGYLPQFLSGSGTIDERTSGATMRLGVVFGEPTVFAYMVFGFICWSHVLITRKPTNIYARLYLGISVILGLLSGTRAFLVMLSLYAGILAAIGSLSKTSGYNTFGKTAKRGQLLGVVAAARNDSWTILYLEPQCRDIRPSGRNRPRARPRIGRGNICWLAEKSAFGLAIDTG